MSSLRQSLWLQRLLSALLSFVLLLLHVGAATFREIAQDEAIISIYTEQLIQGRISFRDFESVYTSTLNGLLVPLLATPLPVALSVRVVYLLLVLLLGALLTKRLGQTTKLHIWATPAVLLVFPPTPNWWAFTVVLFGIAYALSSSSRVALRTIAWLLLGLVCSSRPEFLVLVIPLFLARIISLSNSQSRHLREAISSLISLLVGIVPLALVLWFGILEGMGLANFLEVQNSIRAGRRLGIETPIDYALVVLLIFSVLLLTASQVALARVSADGATKRQVSVSALCGAVLAVVYTIQRLDTTHLRGSLLLLLLIAGVNFGIMQIPQGTLHALPTYVRRLVTGWLVAAIALFAAQLLGWLNPLDRALQVRWVCTQKSCVPLSEQQFTRYEDILTLLTSTPSKSVFVGPEDLGNPSYSDNWLYLLTTNPSCSRYLEMNPGSLNHPGNRLAVDLVSCDYLILTDRYTEYDSEHSRQLAKDSLNREILAGQSFVKILESDGVSLYRRSKDLTVRGS